MVLDKRSAVDVEVLASARDYKALKQLIDDRRTNPSFIKLLDKRDKLSERAMQIDEVVRKTKAKKSNSFVKIREVTLRSRKIHEELSSVVSQLTDYRSVTAFAAEQASILRDASEVAEGTFKSFDADTLNDLVSAGEYSSGTEEWHAQRLSGIGGSDVGKIMRADSEYASSDYRDVLLTKLELSREPEDESFREDTATAIGRGNAWEEYLRQMYADNNPDKNVGFCKTSWAGTGILDYVRANFDGLILDDNGFPEAVLEIKTGTKSNKWGDTSEGLFGVPAGYRKQILWYAMNAGLQWGVIAALLDDHDYREYYFTMDDPLIIEEIAQIRKATADFWELITEKKAELANGINTVTVKRKGFPRNINMKEIARKIVIYSDGDFDEIYDAIRAGFKKLPRTNGSYDRDAVQRFLTKMYAKHNPNLRGEPLIGVDIETSHAAVKKGRIIETGIVQLNADGSLETLFSSVHGLPNVALNGLNVGDTSIHRITEDMIHGSEPFEDDNTQSKVLEYLKRGVVVAHNASFEDRFLMVNLKGYAEARDAGEIRILDTREIATRLMIESENSSLESFAEDNGVPYVGAHAATTDTIMMMEALRNFQERLHKKGKFVPMRTTKKSRNIAEKEMVAVESSR